MKLFDGEASMFLENSKVREVISEKQRFNGEKKKRSSNGKSWKRIQIDGPEWICAWHVQGQAVQTWMWPGEEQREVRLEKRTEPNPVEPRERYWNFTPNAMGYFVKWVTRKTHFNYFITTKLHWRKHTLKNAKKHIFSTYWQTQSSRRQEWIGCHWDLSKSPTACKCLLWSVRSHISQTSLLLGTPKVVQLWRSRGWKKRHLGIKYMLQSVELLYRLTAVKN